MAGFLDIETEIGDLGWRLTGASDSTVMILTCPECATSYFVDDSRIPAAGRTVKCSSCGSRWLALPADDDPSAKTVSAKTTPVDAPAPADEAEAAFISTAPAKPPKAARSKGKVREKAKGGRKAEIRIAMLAAVVLLALLAAGLVVFRGQVVRLWPGAAAVYATIGLPVGPPGLVIEGVSAEPGFAFGRPVLSVTGQVRNTGDRTQAIPPMRIRLLDGSGKLVAVKIARPQDPQAPAGSRRYFRIAFEDPPRGAHDLEVAFAPPARSGHPAEAPVPLASPPPSATTPGVAPQEAKPLAPGSPDALPDHG
jgi:predicted Zn finger-like uncharacterized protein